YTMEPYAAPPTPAISLASGSLGPVPTLEAVITKGLQQIDPGLLLHYGSALGMPELREEVARLHTGVSAAEVMVTASAQQALALALDHALRADRAILVQEPAYFGVPRPLPQRPAPGVPLRRG